MSGQSNQCLHTRMQILLLKLKVTYYIIHQVCEVDLPIDRMGEMVLS